MCVCVCMCVYVCVSAPAQIAPDEATPELEDIANSSSDESDDGKDCIRRAGDTPHPNEGDTTKRRTDNSAVEEVDKVAPGDEFSDSSDDEAQEPFVVDKVLKRRTDGKVVIKVKGSKQVFEYGYVKRKVCAWKYNTEDVVTRTLLDEWGKEQLLAECKKRGKSCKGGRGVLLKRVLKMYGWGPKGKHFADWWEGKVFDNTRAPLTAVPGFSSGPWQRPQRQCPSPKQCFHQFFTHGKHTHTAHTSTTRVSGPRGMGVRRGRGAWELVWCQSK